MNYLDQLEEPNETDVPGLEEFVDGSGVDGNFAVILFPRLRTSQGIGRLLRTLAGAQRWTVGRVDWRKHGREGAALVGLQFRTSHGNQSSVMGFAPLGCMPVTRRAPFVALAVWGGTKLNNHKQTQGNGIGFVDAPTFDAGGMQVTAEAHEAMWSGTRSRVTDLLRDPPEDGWRLKDVAFCLPEAVVAEFVDKV